MKSGKILLSVYLLALSTMAIAATPYAGQQNREIKSLSKAEIEGYLNGKGMGLAKAAELNSYPGPRHVLDLSNELELTDQQIKKTNAIYKSMHKKAMTLGREFINTEKEIESRFQTGVTNHSEIQNLMSRSAKILGDIRFAHVEAHLQQREILTTEQINLYNKLRGYGKQAHHKHKHHH